MNASRTSSLCLPTFDRPQFAMKSLRRIIAVSFFLAIVRREETRKLARSGRERDTRKRREEKREQGTGTLPAHGTRFCLSGRRAGRLITVAFCGFVARHDPRAFRGPHCSASNRSRNGAERSFFVGELVDSRARRCVHSLAASIVDTTSLLVIFSSFLFYDSFVAKEIIAR